MRVGLHSSFPAAGKEPLADMVGRIRQAFLDAGLREPAIRFTLVDSHAAGAVSAVHRVLKRHPEMERFLEASPSLPGQPEKRLLSNAGTGEAAPYSTILAIAAGVPRSYPFNGIGLHFHEPAFGEALVGLPKIGHALPGVMVTDNWWVNGRERSLSVYTVVEADENGKNRAPNPEPVAAVIQALGKVKRTVQVAPILVPGGPLSIPAANAAAVKAIVADYRARMKEVVDRAGMPHELAPAAEIRLPNAGVTAGKRKPALETAFEPMGYACRGGSGEFHLTRRTTGNLTAELYLDVGTWSHEVSAGFLVEGAGFKASLAVPVAPRSAPGSQYPIGDAAQWRRIVENLAAIVRELDRGFVREIEVAAAPSPHESKP